MTMHFAVVRVREIADARALMTNGGSAASVEAITGRGIEPTELEDYGEARKYVFHDPDGNEIGSSRPRSPS